MVSVLPIPSVVDLNGCNFLCWKQTKQSNTMESCDYMNHYNPKETSMSRLEQGKSQWGCFIPSFLICSSMSNLLCPSQPNLVDSSASWCSTHSLRFRFMCMFPYSFEDEEKLDAESEVNDASFFIRRAPPLPVASVSSKSLSSSASSTTPAGSSRSSIRRGPVSSSASSSSVSARVRPFCLFISANFMSPINCCWIRYRRWSSQTWIKAWK